MGSSFGLRYTVVELGESVSTSACGMYLRQAGMQVIKVEPAEGSPIRCASPHIVAGTDKQSALFAYLNVGKQIVRGSDAAEESAIIHELLSRGIDAVIIAGGLPPGGSAMTSDEVRELAPDAVIGRITAFGEANPYSDMIWNELQLQALGGLMYVVGLADREPLRLGMAAMQYAAGAALFTGTMIGLYGRKATGRAGSFETSVFELVPYLEWKNAISYQAYGDVLTRGDAGLPVILPCTDGHCAFFYRDINWDAVRMLFADRRLEAPEFSTAQLRQDNLEQLCATLADAARTWDKQTLYRRAQELMVPVGYVASSLDLLTDEQYQARQFMTPIPVGLPGATVPGAPWHLHEATEIAARTGSTA